jgi:hypothetical protein
MFKLKNNIYIEDSRDWREGSLLHFNLESLDLISTDSLSDLQIQRIKTLFQCSLKQKDKTLSKTDIQKYLNIKQANSSRFIQNLVLKKALQKINNFKHHSNRSNIFAYKFVEPKPNFDLTQNTQSLLDENSNQSMARRYSSTTDLTRDDFHSLEDKKLFSALFGSEKIIVSFNDFLVEKGKKAKKSSKVFKSFNESGTKINIETGLESEIGCLDISDSQFIYTLINLTIQYHLAHSNIYSQTGETEVIANVTPIARDDVMTWLNFPKNATGRLAVNNKIYQIQNNRFTLKATSENNKFIDIIEGQKQLYQVISSESRKYKNTTKDVTPYRYFLKWDVNVLKQIFNTELFFLLPEAVISAPYIIFKLYLHARSQVRKETHEFDIGTLGKILNMNNTSDIINSTIKTFKKAFPKTYSEKRTGKTIRSKLINCKAYGEIGGMQFGLQGKNLHKKNAEFIVFICVDKNAVLKSSQPRIIQERYFKQDPIKSKSLTKISRGSQSPVKFNANLPLVSNKLESDDYNIITNKVETLPKLKSTQLEYKKFTIRRRTYSLQIIVGHATYSLSLYTPLEFQKDIINDIVKLTGRDCENVESRINRAMDKLKLFKCKNNLQLPIDILHKYTNEYKLDHFNTIKKLQLKIIILSKLDLNNKDQMDALFKTLCAKDDRAS